MNLGVAIRPSN